MTPDADTARCVAILTPSGGDAPLGTKVLARHGIEAIPCRDMKSLCSAVAGGVGALLVSEEALSPVDQRTLLDALATQPPWSDIPVVLLVAEGELSGSLSQSVRAIAEHGNVTLLERPVRVATLTTALRAALKARARQFEMRDAITRSETSEREIGERESQLRAAVESSPYPLMVYAEDGTVIHISRTWSELTGYSKEQITTVQTWLQLAFGAGAREVWDSIFDDRLSLRPVGVSAPAQDRDLHTRNGMTRTWSFHPVNLGTMSDGHQVRLMAAVDVTETRRLLANERMLRKIAEEANMAKMQFLATMSHELRTPLNAIGGHVQLLELGILGPVNDKQMDALRRVRRAEGHLLGLINDVLNFAKIEAGRVTFDIKPISLTLLFEGVDGLIEPQMRARNLHYSRAGNCDDLKVLADLEKARQVVLNLLSNAVKFTEPGGRVMIACHEDDDVVYIRISDTGVGIASEVLDSMFEPFVQVRAEYSGSNEGTGLGLAISRDLARAMNGDITAQSEVGKGSIFEFTLPRAPSDGRQGS
ncbi:MAG: sensor protein [Gemmatimonadetes bacterium]|nr:sensor protein [Gemmatimonadota bacterium]